MMTYCIEDVSHHQKPPEIPSEMAGYFVFNRRFESFEELEQELFDYVNWYNNIQIHGSLDYRTSVQYIYYFHRCCLCN